MTFTGVGSVPGGFRHLVPVSVGDSELQAFFDHVAVPNHCVVERPNKEIHLQIVKSNQTLPFENTIIFSFLCFCIVLVFFGIIILRYKQKRTQKLNKTQKHPT